MEGLLRVMILEIELQFDKLPGGPTVESHDYLYW